MDCLEISFPPVPDELEAKSRDQLPLDDEKKQKILHLKSLLRCEDVSYPDDEALLLQFLRVRHFDTVRAATLCKTFFRTRHERKYEYLYGDVSLPQLMRKLSQNKCFGVMPSRDRDGSVVIILFTGLWDPGTLSPEEFQRGLVFTIMQCMRCPLTQVAGFKFIADFSRYSISHLTSFSPRRLWYTLDSLQNCIPCPIRGIYFVNENAIFTRMWSFFKRVVKQKIRERVHFLGSDLEALHQTFPASTLPDQLGGTTGPFSTKPLEQLMGDFDKYFAFIGQYGCREDKRQKTCTG